MRIVARDARKTEDSNGTSVSLSPGDPVMVVGRDQRMAHLVVRDAVISRKQCSFHYGVDGLYLTDNRSACGTMVGGVMINHATRVHPGDAIFIGDSMLIIERA